MTSTDRQKELAAKLTSEELKFVGLYLSKEEHGNSTGWCYMQTGRNVTKKSASTIASKMLKKVHIREYIDYMKGVSVTQMEQAVVSGIDSIIDHLKIEAGIKERPIPKTDDEGNQKEIFTTTATSRVNALKTLFDYGRDAERNASPIALDAGTDLGNIDKIINAMAAGDISIGVGKELINCIKIKMDLEDVHILADKIKEFERIIETMTNDA